MVHANKGKDWAETLVAQQYHQGSKAVNRDLKKAVHYYKLSAEDGDRTSLCTG